MTVESSSEIERLRRANHELTLQIERIQAEREELQGMVAELLELVR